MDAALLNPPKLDVHESNVGKMFFRHAHKLLAIVVIAWLSNGVFSYAMPYTPNYIRWGLFLTWFVIAVASKENFLKTFIKQSWPLLLFYLYIVYLNFFNQFDYFALYQSFLYLIMIYTVFLYYFDDKYKQFQRVLIAFIAFDYVFVGISTYIKLQQNPSIARVLSGSSANIESTLGTNASFSGIGNYGYFYSLVPVIFLLGFLFLNYRKRKMLMLFSMIAVSFVLIKASFTIALLFTFVFLLLMFLRRFVGKKAYWCVVIFGGISLISLHSNLSSLFLQIALNSGASDEVSARLVDISYFLSDGYVSGTGSLNTRMHLYTKSLEAFSHSPLLGTSSSVSSLYAAGEHSSWLDAFARFGLMFILFCMFLIKTYRHTKSKISNKFTFFVNIYWVYFICLGFINTLFFSCIFVSWFLFLPMAINAFQQKPESITPAIPKILTSQARR